jgi:hypothetical protein
MHKEIVHLAKTSGYHTILNENLRGGKPTTPDSIFEEPVKEKSTMGNESNDPQPGLSGHQTPVAVEDDKMSVDNPLSFSASPSYPATHLPSIRACPTALHLKIKKCIFD